MKVAVTLTGLVVCVVVLIFGASMSKPVPHTEPKWAEYAAKVATTSDVDNAEKIPLYPNAENVEHSEHPLQKLFPVTTFETNDAPEDVIAFYKVVLPKKGWELDEHFVSRAFTRVDCLWSDSEGVLPWRAMLKILVDSSGLQSGKRAQVELHQLRLPDATKVPLYPGAQHIEAKDVLGEYDSIDRITSYEVNASPMEVEAYYKSRLPGYGWVPGWGSEEGVGSISQGLLYSYDFGGPEASTWGRVTIVARTEVSGQTRVEIQAEGTDIPKQSER